MASGSSSLLLLLVVFSLVLFYSATHVFAELRLSEPQQCHLQQLNAAQPAQIIESEGGTTQLWDELQDQFRCAAISPMKNVLRPNALSLPNYHASPRLVYIERGQALMGLLFPGCAETFHSDSDFDFSPSGTQEGREEPVWDLHQKVYRVRQGDIVAIPPGFVHYCYNDGREDLVAVSINDLNHESNKLDQKNRVFYLAGGLPNEFQQQFGQTFQNIFRKFDTQLLAEAYNVPPQIIERMQSAGQEMGLSVMANEPMTFLRPDEEQGTQQRRQPQPENGVEETICSMKFHASLDDPRAVDFSFREAGKLNVVDRRKLPILGYMDLSAEKGHLYPNAMESLDWETLGHSIIYVTRGNAKIQMTDNRGKAVMDETVNQGDMFVVPQLYVSTARAGNEGFEWVTFKTTGWPMRNPVVGYTSVIKGMPIDVLSHAYRVSPEEAYGLKMKTGSQSLLLPPHGQTTTQS